MVKMFLKRWKIKFYFKYIFFLDKSAVKDESFSIELYDPKGGVKLGRVSKTVVTIINDDGKLYLFKHFLNEKNQ